MQICLSSFLENFFGITNNLIFAGKETSFASNSTIDLGISASFYMLSCSLVGSHPRCGEKSWPQNALRIGKDL